MKVSNIVKYSFTRKDIERILIEHVAQSEGIVEVPYDHKIRWDIVEGDQGPKDPMDYSDHVSTHVKTVEITL